jgi:hypothetical protein
MIPILLTVTKNSSLEKSVRELILIHTSCAYVEKYDKMRVVAFTYNR